MNSAVAQVQQSFLDNYPTKEFQKGEIVVFQGEAPRYTYVVKEGVVKSYNLSVNGDEKPVSFYDQGTMFPVPWTFGKAPSSFYYFEAFTDVKLHCVPREAYLQFIQQHPRVAYQLLESFVSEHIGNTMRLNALQHSRASDKLLYTLHYLTMTHSRPIGPRQVEITLSLTHQDFANLTGLTRETTATELNRLKTQGVISYGKQTLYKVKLDKLHDVINDQFLADMEINP